MKLMLRTKLVLSFVTVIVITGAVATAVGVHLISSGIVREAQNKVTLDLNSARQIYEQRLNNIETLVSFTAIRQLSVINALKEGNRELLFKTLQETMQKSNFDFLTLTDKKGAVVIRASNPNVFGDRQVEDEIIGKVLLDRKPIAHSQILPYEELLKESQDLVKRARIAIVPTPHAIPSTEKENTAGLVMKAAVPIYDENRTFLGILYGGVLLNRNYEIVDTIKDIVYRGVKYKGKDTGTATIFLRDLRISTNVLLDNGERAIGTRVSREVYDQVIVQGEIWKARAFVVNDWYLTAYAQIKNIDDKAIGMLYVGILEKKYTDMKQSAFWVFFGLCIAGIIFALIIGYILAEAIARPVLKLKEGFEALETGNFDFNIHVMHSDEIGNLTESFNRVRGELKETYAKLQGKIEAADEDLKKAYKELQEKQEILVQKEKLASLGQLSAGVAHELNNPLGTILVFSHMLLKELPKEDTRRKDVEMIASEATRCRNIVRGLVDFARESRVSKEPTDIAELINEVVSIMSPKSDDFGVNLTSNIQGDLPKILLDATQIKQMLINLVDNGIDAIKVKGEVRITANLSDSGDALEIKVTDNGCGIREEDFPRLFTPFFTTKEMGKGTGLGLAIAYGVVKMHSGNISAESHIGEGTTFSIWIPCTVKKELCDQSAAKA